MITFVLRRMIYGAAVLFGVITLVFFLFTILPGDPARMMLGQHADQKAVDDIRSELGLDQPVAIQYINYLNDLSPISFYRINKESDNQFEKYGAHLKIISIKDVSVILKAPYMRNSYQSKRTVSNILGEAFPNTLLLASVSILFALILGVVIGVIAAIVNKAFFNRFVLVLTTIGMSLPSFFAAILIAWIFGFLLEKHTGLSMFGSLYSVDDFGNGEYLNLKNLILPAITLGIRPLAIITELTRTSLLETLSMDYIRTAKAKGLKSNRIISIHALRNAMNPVVTAVSGWFASLLAGAVFVEYVFDWKGIGVVIVDSLDKYDLPVIMGSVLLIALMLIIINIFVDIIYGLLDPRVRFN